MKNHHLFASAALLAASLFTSCASLAPEPVKPRITAPIVSYPDFKAQTSYPNTMEVYRNDQVLARTNANNSKIRISLSAQRAFLMNGEEIALDYPISSGDSSHSTATGRYTIQEMEIDKRSTCYGRVISSSGETLDSDADSRTASVPSGASFVGAPMPFWMRLTWYGIGMHVGHLPGYPASHGCIRGPEHIMPLVYSKARVGTPVHVVE